MGSLIRKIHFVVLNINNAYQNAKWKHSVTLKMPWTFFINFSHEEVRERKYRNESKRKIHKWRDERWKMHENCLCKHTHTHILWRWVEIDVCHHSLKVLAISWGRNIFKQQLMLKWDGFKRLKLSVPFAFSNNLSREISFCIQIENLKFILAKNSLFASLTHQKQTT